MKEGWMAGRCSWCSLLQFGLIFCFTMAGGEHKAEGGHAKLLASKPDPDFPVDSDGRCMHLQVKKGELANRILTVGDSGRAERLSKFFDGGKFLKYTSTRGFTTYTGSVDAVPVSILCIGMGGPMADFAVREACGVVEGPLAMCRLGSCGGLRETPPSSIALASGGVVGVTTEYGELGGGEGGEGGVDLHEARADRPYRISRKVPADAELSRLVREQLDRVLEEDGCFKDGASVVEGVGASADSFYSGQGRRLDKLGFDDKNEALLKDLETLEPEVVSMEMEHFWILATARRSGRVRATAMAIPALNRRTGKWTPPEMFTRLEYAGGRAAMHALAKIDLKAENPHTLLPE